MTSRARQGCALGAVVLCGLAGFLAWRASTPPRVTDTVPFSQAAPQEQQQRREEAKRFTDQVNEVAASARRKEKKPFTITATEQVLNTLLQDRLDTEKFPVRDLRAGLEPGKVVLQGRVLYKGFDAVATLGGNIVANKGKLEFKADSLQVGGLPAPANWKNKIETTVTEKLNQLLKNAPGRINSVAVEQDKLTIEGVTD